MSDQAGCIVLNKNTHLMTLVYELTITFHSSAEKGIRQTKVISNSTSIENRIHSVSQ